MPNVHILKYTLDMAIKIWFVICLPMKSLIANKIQFLLHEREVLEHLLDHRSSRMTKMVLLVSSIEKTFSKK